MALGASVTGIGIWATHFVAMLAFDTGLPTGYAVGLTLLSLVIAALVTAAGFAIALFGPAPFGLWFGGVVVGGGIAAMHFTGMAGLQVPASRGWDPSLVLLACGLGLGISALVLRQACTDASMRGLAIAACLLTLAICSMHFTAMAALELTPDPSIAMPSLSLTPDRLAVDVGFSAFVVLALSLTGAFVDDYLARRRVREADRLRHLVNATFEGIGICVDGRLVDANDALVEMLATPLDALRRRPIIDFIAPKDKDRYAGRSADMDRQAIELQLVPAEGKPIHVELLTGPLDYGDKAAEVVAVRDVTERRSADEKLAVYREHLERQVMRRTAELEEKTARLQQALGRERELSLLQRQFVSTVSHEFRTPLAIIDGLAQRLLRRPDKATPDFLNDTLSRITTAVKRLTDLMESVLSSSRLETGTIEFAPADCRLAELIEECCSHSRQISPSHAIELDVTGLPAMIVADGKLLRQVFANLLSNAVKYSPGRARIRVDGRCDGELATVAVRDDGLGIPKDQQPNVFRRFFRARTAEGIAGTGIGLNLVRQLVEMHGGRVTFESDEGVGSTFTVRLPMARPPPAAAPAFEDDVAVASSLLDAAALAARGETV